MANSSDNFYSESSLIKLQDGKEYRKLLFEETQRVLASMLEVLPSVYSATIPSTNYGTHLKRVALEIARLRVESENIQNDASIDTVRPEYLYQKFGYQVQVNNTFFPTTDFSDEDYRAFLKAVLNVLFNGATVENIREALHIFTGHPVEVRDATSNQSSISYSYIDYFRGDKLLLLGTPENISNLRISDPAETVLYSLGVDYYDATESLTHQVLIKKLSDGSLQNDIPVLVQFSFRNALVDQFKLKIFFDRASVEYPNKPDDILQKISFLLQLIKPAHVYPDVRVYESDNLRRPVEFFPLDEEEDLFLGIDTVKSQSFISNSYDDFRVHTRNVSDTQAIEFNNLDTVMNKISETYNDVGYYLNEADPLYRKKYRLFQMRGISAQSSSLLNSPYTLEFNELQTSIFNNVSVFDETQGTRMIAFPEVEPNTDLPIRDTSSDSDEVKVTALAPEFGVQISAGTLYSYQVGQIVSFPSVTEIVLPEEAKGNRVYIYISLTPTPSIDYQISPYGILDLEDPYIPLAYVDIPEDALVVWDSYIRDLRVYKFINLTLRGDTSGFSEFNTSKGTVLGLGTRPIRYKFDDNQTEVIYQTENLNVLNSFDFELNQSFILGIDAVGYTSSDLNLLFSGLEAEIETSPVGSIATPCFEGALAFGLVFGSESETDKVQIFEEDTTFLLNDTLYRQESLTIVSVLVPLAVDFSGVLAESFTLFNETLGVPLVSGVDYVFDVEAGTITFPSALNVNDGDILTATFWQEFGTLFNRDLLYASNSTYASFDFVTAAEDTVDPVAEVIDLSTSQSTLEHFGVPLPGLLFNTASLTTGTVTGLAFPTGTQLVLNSFSTNLAKYSEAFNSWSSYGTVTVTTNATADPNGDLTAERLVWGSTGYNGKYQSIPVLSGSAYVFSVWIKRIAASNPIGLAIVDSNGATVYGSTLVTPTTNWVRYSVTGTVTGTGTSVTARIINRSTSPYSADIYVWGGQFETGTTVSAYTKTNATGTVVSLLNQPAQQVVSPVVYFNESAPSLTDLDLLGPIEQLALEGVSIIDQNTGLPVLALNGLPVS